MEDTQAKPKSQFIRQTAKHLTVNQSTTIHTPKLDKVIHATQQVINFTSGEAAAKKKQVKFTPSIRWTFENLSAKISQMLNDCICFEFQGVFCDWKLIPQFPLLKERESHGAVILEDQYIFLYGGCNQQEVYNDCWVFNMSLGIWFQITQIEGNISKRMGFTLNKVQDMLLMFGGEVSETEISNQLFQLILTSYDFSKKETLPTLKFQKVKCKGKMPPPRCSHASVVCRQNILIILGGQTTVTIKGQPTTILLNDVWMLDSVEKQWTEISISNSSMFKPRSCFSATEFENKLYIFGGIISVDNFRSSDELFVLDLTELFERKIQVCNICKLQDYNGRQIKAPTKQYPLNKSFKFQIKNIFKLTRMMKNPFDAFVILLEGLCSKGYDKLNCDYIQGKIFMFEGSGTSLSRQQFLQFSQNFSIPEESPFNQNQQTNGNTQQLVSHLDIFIYNIRNACARLGNSFLLINTHQMLQDILLFTVDNIFYCEYDLEMEDEEGFNFSQKNSSQIIKNYLQRHHLNIHILEKNTFCLFVTDLRTLNPHQSEIKVEGERLELAGLPSRIVLNDYLKKYFLKKSQLNLFINSQPLDFECPDISEKNIYSRAKKQIKYFNLNSSDKDQDIYIYRGNYLINKYHRRKLPLYSGYAVLSSTCELNILRNNLENILDIRSSIDEIIEDLYSQSNKRNPIITTYDLEQNHKY